MMHRDANYSPQSTTNMASPAPDKVYFDSPLAQDEHENLAKHISKFLDIYEKLEPVNDPDIKPNYSYSELLMMAILRSPNYCRPIHEVYAYIKDRYLFYQHTKKGFWKNAIRHSLSKTRCFTKLGVGRSMKPGGILHRPVYLWTIVPECLVKFAKGDYRVNLDSNGANNLKCAFQQVKAEAFWTNVAKNLAGVLSAIKETMSPEIEEERKVAPKRKSDFYDSAGTGNNDTEQTTRMCKRTKLGHDVYNPNGSLNTYTIESNPVNIDINSYTPTGMEYNVFYTPNGQNTKVEKYGYSAPPFAQYEVRPISTLRGMDSGTNANYGYGYDFTSMIPDIALNYSTCCSQEKTSPHTVCTQSIPSYHGQRKDTSVRNIAVLTPQSTSSESDRGIEVFNGLGSQEYVNTLRTIQSNTDSQTERVEDNIEHGTPPKNLSISPNATDYAHHVNVSHSMQYSPNSVYVHSTPNTHFHRKRSTKNVTSPGQRSTSPNSSIDVTGSSNTSFSDSFRSVDNEDRKPYVEVENADFGGVFLQPAVSKFSTQHGDLLELLSHNGLAGVYQFQ